MGLFLLFFFSHAPHPEAHPILVRWEGPGGWYGEVGRQEASGWGAFLKFYLFKDSFLY